jgi:hypothetical protein
MHVCDVCACPQDGLSVAIDYAATRTKLPRCWLLAWAQAQSCIRWRRFM